MAVIGPFLIITLRIFYFHNDTVSPVDKAIRCSTSIQYLIAPLLLDTTIVSSVSNCCCSVNDVSSHIAILYVT